MAISYYDLYADDIRKKPDAHIEMVKRIQEAGNAFAQEQDAARAREREAAAARASKRKEMDAEATVKYSGDRKKLREQNLGHASARDPVYPPGHPKAPSPLPPHAPIGAPPPTGDTSASASESTRGFDLGGMLAWLMTREHYNSHVHSTGTLAADTTALVYQSRAMRGPIRVLAEGEASKETSEEDAMDASDDEEDAMDASDGEREAVDMAVAAATPSRVLTRSTAAAIQQAADVARKEYMEQRKRAQARLLPTVFCMAEARELAARADRQAGVCRAFSSKRRRDSDEGNPSTPAPRRQRSVQESTESTASTAPATDSMKTDAGAVALNAVRLAQLTVDSQWCGVRRAR
jgi:hypothetical protein